MKAILSRWRLRRLMKETSQKPPSWLKPTEAGRREEFAKTIRLARSKDRGIVVTKKGKPEKRRWSIAGDSSLKDLRKFYGRSLTKEVWNHFTKTFSPEYYRFLDLGCGKGRVASQMEKFFGEMIQVSACGVARVPEWKAHKNSDKIDWHIIDADNLSNVFSRESIDFINSNLGINAADKVEQALNECHKVLREGGRVIFTLEPLMIFRFSEDGFHNGFRRLEKKFKLIHYSRRKNIMIPETNERTYSRRAPLHVFILEKK